MDAPNTERFGFRSDMVVGVLIVVVSIFGAFVTWRASEAANAASDLELRGRQAAIFRDQIQREHESVVSYERRLFDAFRSHVRTADALERDASRLERRHPGAASALRREARAERAVARALELPFESSPVDESSLPTYDAQTVLARRLSDDIDLEELRPLGLNAAADRARDKRFALVAIDTAVIAAIFFLTLALLSARARRFFALLGSGLAAASLAACIVVYVLIRVPAL